MATNFPTSLDSLSNPSASDLVENATAALDHHTQHSNANDAIEALEAKVGIDSSGVTTSHDYKLSGVTGTDKAVSKTGTETLTNKTLTSPVLTTPALGTPASGTLTNCTGLPEAGLTLADNTTNDVSATKHGFAPKIPNNTTTFLRGDATYAAPTITCASGSTSRDISTANGTQTIAHGLGVNPSMIRVTAVLSNADFISYATCVLTSSASYLSLAAGLGSSTTNAFGSNFDIYKDGSNSVNGVITKDATNISIAWTKNSSPTGTAQIMWEAIR